MRRTLIIYFTPSQFSVDNSSGAAPKSILKTGRDRRISFGDDLGNNVDAVNLESSDEDDLPDRRKKSKKQVFLQYSNSV